MGELMTSKNPEMRVGEAFPDFDLEASDGERYSLDSLKGSWSVIFFYPRDGTTGCTAQSCAFRDKFSVFQEFGVKIFGVSSNSISSHQRFISDNQLPFILLSDKGGVLRKELGIRKTLWFIPGRVTFVIDPAGLIRKVINSQFFFSKHSEVAANFIEESIAHGKN